MPINTECPECGKRLKAPDSAAGRKAKCPQCGAAVPIPERVYEAEEVFEAEGPDAYEDYESEDGADYPLGRRPARRSSQLADRRRCPMCGETIKATASRCRYCGEPLTEDVERGDVRLGTVRSGVATIYYGLLTTLASFILGAVLGGVLNSPEILIGFMILAGLGMIAMFIGKLLCLAVPPEVGATGLIYTSVGLDLVSLATNVAQIFGDVPPIVLLVVGVGGLTATILFLVFLKRLCEFIRRSDLIALSGQVITLFVALIVGYILLVLVVIATGNQPIAVIGGLTVFVLALVTIMRYGRLLTYLKDAL